MRVPTTSPTDYGTHLGRSKNMFDPVQVPGNGITTRKKERPSVRQPNEIEPSAWTKTENRSSGSNADWTRENAPCSSLTVFRTLSSKRCLIMTQSSTWRLFCRFFLFDAAQYVSDCGSVIVIHAYCITNRGQRRPGQREREKGSDHDVLFIRRPAFSTWQHTPREFRVDKTKNLTPAPAGNVYRYASFVFAHDDYCRYHYYIHAVSESRVIALRFWSFNASSYRLSGRTNVRWSWNTRFEQRAVQCLREITHTRCIRVVRSPIQQRQFTRCEWKRNSSTSSTWTFPIKTVRSTR